MSGTGSYAKGAANCDHLRQGLLSALGMQEVGRSLTLSSTQSVCRSTSRLSILLEIVIVGHVLRTLARCSEMPTTGFEIIGGFLERLLARDGAVRCP